MKTAEKRMIPTDTEIVERLFRVLAFKTVLVPLHGETYQDSARLLLPVVKALMLEARWEEHLQNHEHAATPSSRIAGFCRWCSALDRELAVLGKEKT